MTNRRPGRRQERRSPRVRTIIDALTDRRLFGALPAFTDLSSWQGWIVFLKAVYGLALDASERAIFRRHTGRLTYQPPRGGWREVVAVVGRQSGKSRIASVIASFEAVRATAERDGTETHALLVAQDQRAALHVLFRYAQRTFEEVPALKRDVATSLTSSLTLKNGVVVTAYPCRPAAVRGLRARIAVLDELAFYRSTENTPIDREMLRAVRPCLATTGGKLIVLSSPYGPFGALWDLHRRHYARSDASTLIWQATAPEMNPTLPADYLRQMAEDDPEAYRSEILGEFRAGAATLLDPAAVAACVAEGVRERPRETRAQYVSFVDVASGSGQDAFAAAIAHHDGERAVLDVVRAWQPPFNPTGVIAEVADLLRRYDVRETEGDGYAAGFVTEGFRAAGVTYAPATRNRSELFLELLLVINARQVVLLDVPDLMRELRGLERRRGLSGRDRVDHMPGAHDDRAVAAAGALVAASATSGRMSAASMAHFCATVVSDGHRQSRWHIGDAGWGR